MEKEKEILTNPENILLEEEVRGFESTIAAIKSSEARAILAARILNMIAQAEKKQLLTFRKGFNQKNELKFNATPSKEELSEVTNYYSELRNRVYVVTYY